MSTLILETPNEHANAQIARDFCHEFCKLNDRPKFVLGRNVYAESIGKHIEVSGFIDDFTSETVYLGKPICKTEAVPNNALVLNAAGGRPLTAKQHLDKFELENIDYFAFYKYSGLLLTDIIFNEGAAQDFAANESKYQWIFALLADEESRLTFRKLLSFRLIYDLDVLAGFTSRENEQYFEGFLQLHCQNESFIDVGGFDGFSSLAFIQHCPEYRSIHLFEPDPGNYPVCVKNLDAYPNVLCHPLGLSNKKETLRMALQGSGSVISEEGAVTIDVDRLDDVLRVDDVPTFIKIDIEGSESAAIDGARQTIKTHHPRLAICVYHKVGDFWRIPEQVLAIRDDYTIYLRHYTESIYETVMFFIPKG